MPVKSIVTSVEKVFKSRDIQNLSTSAYKCLYLMSGFIAHYDINGFRHVYKNTSDLARNILDSMDTKDAARYARDPWFANEYGTVYCESKTAVYSQLRDLAARYVEKLIAHDNKAARDSDIAYARELLAKHGESN